MNKYMMLALIFVVTAAKPDEPTILSSGTLFINSDEAGGLSRLEFGKDNNNLIG